MKRSAQAQNVLKKLTRDPRLKQAIAKARRETRGNGRRKIENVTDMFLLVLTIASRFSKKKKARALDELADMVYLLVQTSLVVKENIFDRPEVKKFFTRSSRQLYSFAQECVAMILPKPKTLRPSAGSLLKTHSSPHRLAPDR